MILESISLGATNIKIGERVVLRVPAPGVPVDTEGVIDELYEGGFSVAWDLPDRPLPEDWFWNVDDPKKWAVSPTAPLRDGFSNEEAHRWLYIVVKEED